MTTASVLCGPCGTTTHVPVANPAPVTDREADRVLLEAVVAHQIAAHLDEVAA